MDAGAADEGFSPLRMAKSGRRAGRQVAIVEPTASTSAAEQQEDAPELSGQQKVLRLSSSDCMQEVQRGDAHQQQQQQQQQPSALQEQASNSTSAATNQQSTSDAPASKPASTPAPPAKRVGFSLQGGASDGNQQDSNQQQQQQQFTGVSRRKQEQLQREEQSQARQRSKYDEKCVDALIDVPELEEEGKEDITRIVAQAPKASAPHMQAVSELELDQSWMPRQGLRSTDINLSLLTACLLPSSQVMEPPDVWDFDLLFSQLKAELQNEAGGETVGAEDLQQA